MKINEIFQSIQGEGKLCGMPSVFIRTSGCNLRCVWCDTPYASWQPEGESLTIDGVFERLAAYDAVHVVITGGEPMIDPEVVELTSRLKQAGYHITIETAATVWKDVVCDLASISPKLANSTPWERDGGRWAQTHEATRIDLKTIKRFMCFPDYQLKFVVDSPDDLGEIDTLLAQLGRFDPGDVLLMPQGVTQAELGEKGRWIAEICNRRGFRYCPRLQITLFGHTRGT